MICPCLQIRQHAIARSCFKAQCCSFNNPVVNDSDGQTDSMGDMVLNMNYRNDMKMDIIMT